MQKISKRTVASVVPEQKSRIIWDTEIKGFGLLVLPSGVKSYVYQYRTQENRSRRTTIGQSHKLTADQARKKALGLQHDVVHGGDPLAIKQANRKAIRVSQLLDLYLESSKFSEKTASTQAADRGRINSQWQWKPWRACWVALFRGLTRRLSIKDVRPHLSTQSQAVLRSTDQPIPDRRPAVDWR